MRLLTGIVLLFAFACFAGESQQEGRFHLVNSGGAEYMVDTQTGRLWIVAKGEEGVHLAEVRYKTLRVEKDKKKMMTPDKDMEFLNVYSSTPFPPSVSQTRYKEEVKIVR